MITIRVKHRDILVSKMSNCYPTYEAIARYLNASWRGVEIKGNEVNVFSENDELEGVYHMSDEDAELVSEINKEWDSNREYFFSPEYDTITFHIKKKHADTR